MQGREYRIPHKIIRKLKEEEGASAVIIALTFTALLLVAALVIDYGMAQYRTGEMQNASDAASLAAARYLPVPVTDTAKILLAKDIAIEYAQKNGFSELTYEHIVLSDMVNDQYTSIQVTLNLQEKTHFSSVLGFEYFTLTRSAVAKVAPCETITGAVPFAVKQSVIETHIENGYTTGIALKFGGGSGTTGDFGVIDLDGVNGGGANDIERWILDGYFPPITAGEDLYRVETGNMAEPIDAAVNDRYHACTHYPENGGCNKDLFDAECSRILKIPIVNFVDSKQLIITGFAAFILEPTTEYGYVYGSLIELTIPGIASVNIGSGTPGDYGLYATILTE
jgi:hypothetical protein